MSRVAFTPAAAADLSDIWDHTAATWGVAQAERYTDGIRDLCTDLAEGRRTGRSVEVRAGYLKYPVGRHILFYRANEAGIELVRILHQRMDVERHL
ncbi:type II toxin-antitoxin system RelE/ParE family toxin [Psychromarinibacter sp. C21-152]|uniref:Toxin n=1 Tax=Psychromarinibacter sediminicola TaxID=3033385 RepID=A0AAE3NRI4_9RHOB|nr:type II toxin-antitoxin system RelE/ParE family toxin [Psychromarinibacter sediminicola]MDF0602188.1 type II toxin-antitoxin system RelE/ParE family toxin [Psychromarinibacter sediminicola]